MFVADNCMILYVLLVSLCFGLFWFGTANQKIRDPRNGMVWYSHFKSQSQIKQFAFAVKIASLVSWWTAHYFLNSITSHQRYNGNRATPNFIVSQSVRHHFTTYIGHAGGYMPLFRWNRLWTTLLDDPAKPIGLSLLCPWNCFLVGPSCDNIQMSDHIHSPKSAYTISTSTLDYGNFPHWLAILWVCIYVHVGRFL